MYATPRHVHATVVAETHNHDVTDKSKNQYRGMTIAATPDVLCAPNVLAYEDSLFGETWCPPSVKLLIAQYAWDTVTCVPEWRHRIVIHPVSRAVYDHVVLYNRLQRPKFSEQVARLFGCWMSDPRAIHMCFKRMQAYSDEDARLYTWLLFLEELQCRTCGTQHDDWDYINVDDAPLYAQ
jgi:hypothetical protein